MGEADWFKIQLANNQECFYSGSTICGDVVVNVESSLEILGIKLNFRGYARNKWTSSNSDADDIHYLSLYTYINEDINLFGGPHGIDIHVIDAGNHKFPFSIIIPPTAPSSLKGMKGKVKYKLTATIEQLRQSAAERKKVIEVYRPLDLNYEIGPSFEINLHEVLDTDCCCISDGNIVAKLYAKKDRFAVGEEVDFNVEVVNRSNRVINYTTLRLEQTMSFTAYRTDGDSNNYSKLKKEKETVDIHRMNKIRPYEHYKSTERVRIPTLPPSHINGCEFTDLSYQIQFLPDHMCFCAEPLKQDVVIGTTPYTGISIRRDISANFNPASNYSSSQPVICNQPGQMATPPPLPPIGFQSGHMAPPPSQLPTGFQPGHMVPPAPLPPTGFQPGQMAPPPVGFAFNVPSEDPPSYEDCVLPGVSNMQPSASFSKQQEKIDLNAPFLEKPPL